jgi:hypothetical protein
MAMFRDRVMSQPGERIALMPDLSKAHLFDAQSGRGWPPEATHSHRPTRAPCRRTAAATTRQVRTHSTGGVPMSNFNRRDFLKTPPAPRRHRAGRRRLIGAPAVHAQAN